MNRQRGASLVFVTIALVSLLGFMGLAIDVGYELVVRNELQNAADSAALAGAKYLYPSNNSMHPNWSEAGMNAASAVGLNKVNSADLSLGDITTGYWSIVGSPAGLQSSSISPKNTDLPAVQVTINKSSGQNGGGVNTFFASILGINTLNMSATGVAINGGSAGFTNSNLFPFVVTQCVYNNYSITTPSQFIITSNAISSVGNCQIGAWSSLMTGNLNISTLISNVAGQSNTNPHKYSIGETIYIDANIQPDNYITTNNCSEVGDGSCAFVPIIVVCDNSPNCDKLPISVGLTIVGFGCMHILSADQNTKTVTAEFVAMGSNVKSSCMLAGAGGSGPSYGAYIPPKLVNYSGNTF